MDLTQFIVYTVIWAGLRNTFLTIIGKYLKENRGEVMKYSHTVDIAVLAILVWILGRFVYRQVKKYQRKRKQKI